MRMMKYVRLKEIILWVLVISGNIDTVLSVLERIYKIMMYLL